MPRLLSACYVESFKYGDRKFFGTATTKGAGVV